MTEATPLRTIALVDDHPMVLDALKELLQRIGGYDVVMCATSGESFIAQMARLPHVHLALVDLSMPGLNGFAVLTWLAEHRPATKGVVVSAYYEPAMVQAAYKAGAKSFVRKNTDARELGSALDHVFQHGHQPTAHVLADAAQAELEQRARALGVPPRELVFLGHVCGEKDLTYKQIAQRMGVSESAVDGYVRWFSTHFDLHSRPALVLWAIEQRLVHAQGSDGLLAHAEWSTQRSLRPSGS